MPARESLEKPAIGGGAPIQPLLLPQPQYIYVTAPGTASGVRPPVATIAPSKTLYQQEQQQQQQYGTLLAPGSVHEQ